MTQVSAFVARSFAPQDEQRIRPILQFLDTFREAGFFWKTAEPAEVESVSEKVRRMIDEADVFIGLFTKRYPVVTLSATLKDAWRLFRGRARPERWTAPAWVLQESGYALRARKQLILLRETDVEVFGLQGDLEYIPFATENPSAVFPALSQMINSLLAKTAGTTVKVTVEPTQKPALGPPEAAPPPAQPEASAIEAGQPDLLVYSLEMFRGAYEHDFEKIEDAWRRGAELIAGGATGKDKLAWDCRYFDCRFNAGDPEALNELRRLRSKNPERPEPIEAMASCFDEGKEFDKSAQLHLEAAALQNGDEKAHSLLLAGQALRELKQYDRAKQVVTEALMMATGPRHGEAVSYLWELLKESGDKYIAFATAEHALHNNPQLALRPSLALEYREKGLFDIALYHFRYLHGQNAQDAGSLHNLALLCDDCKLPIASVANYKVAIDLGETLSAANLGFMYLDSGMADEAKALADKALAVENHNSNVERCLSAIVQKRDEEKQKETNLLDSAATRRRFLVSMGEALASSPPQAEGRWKLPFGEITLTWASAALVGTADIGRAENNLANLLSGVGGIPSPVIDTHVFEGKMIGAVCQFTIFVSGRSVQGSIQPIMLGPRQRSGFVVFEVGGKSGQYVELSDGKLGEIETIYRVA